MDRKCHDSVVVVPKFENPLISFKGFFNLIFGSTDSLFTSRNRAMCMHNIFNLFWPPRFSGSRETNAEYCTQMEAQGDTCRHFLIMSLK